MITLSRDGWKACAERSENLAASRLVTINRLERELKETMRSRDEWKAHAERSENLAASRLVELHARSEEISRVVEERELKQTGDQAEELCYRINDGWIETVNRLERELKQTRDQAEELRDRNQSAISTLQGEEDL